jgi:hypothetical protein
VSWDNCFDGRPIKRELIESATKHKLVIRDGEIYEKVN